MITCQMCSHYNATQVVWQRDENWTAKVCDQCALSSGFVRLEKETKAMNEGDELPERVWMSGKGWPHVRFACLPAEGETEYVRADLARAATPSPSVGDPEEHKCVACGKPAWAHACDRPPLSHVCAGVGECIEAVEEVLDDWNGDYEHYALSGAPTGSAAKEQVNDFASQILAALEALKGKAPELGSLSTGEQARKAAEEIVCGITSYQFEDLKLALTEYPLPEREATTLEKVAAIITKHVSSPVEVKGQKK